MNDNKRSEMSVVGGLNAFSRQLMRAHVGLFHSSINDLLRSAKRNFEDRFLCMEFSKTMSISASTRATNLCSSFI